MGDPVPLAQEPPPGRKPGRRPARSRLRQHLHDRLGQTACPARLYLEGQEAPQERLAQAFGDVGAKDGKPGGEKCRPVHRRDLRYRRDHARPSGRAVIR